MNDSQIPARWLPIVRGGWLVLVLLSMAIFLAGVPHLYRELRQPCFQEECPFPALQPQEVQTLEELGLSMDFYTAYMVGLQFFILAIVIPPAVLIFWRRSDTWMGILLSLTLVSFGTSTSLSSGAAGRGIPVLLWPGYFLDGLGTLFWVLLFYLLPDGRFVPRWTYWVVVIFVVAALMDLLVSVMNSISPFESVGLNIVLLGCMVGGAWAQVYRYRWVSTPSQRQQTKWITFGLLITVIVTVVWTFLVGIFPIPDGPARLAFDLSMGILVLLFMILPISVVFSILRYRLWDIDIIIRRTLIYGSLTLLLALLYFGFVTLLQNLMTAVSGQQSPVVIVISTLAIAALFNPLRHRLQDLIDRRFYRRKYDAEKTLADFAATVRDEVDLEQLSEALLMVVEETIQPAYASLWLAEPEGDLRG